MQVVLLEPTAKQLGKWHTMPGSSSGSTGGSKAGHAGSRVRAQLVGRGELPSEVDGKSPSGHVWQDVSGATDQILQWDLELPPRGHARISYKWLVASNIPEDILWLPE